MLIKSILVVVVLAGVPAGLAEASTTAATCAQPRGDYQVVVRRSSDGVAGTGRLYFSTRTGGNPVSSADSQWWLGKSLSGTWTTDASTCRTSIFLRNEAGESITLSGVTGSTSAGVALNLQGSVGGARGAGSFSADRS